VAVRVEMTQLETRGIKKGKIELECDKVNWRREGKIGQRLK